MTLSRQEVLQRTLTVSRVEDITEALWGTKVSPSLVSDLNQKIYVQIEAWRRQPLSGEYAYVYVDGCAPPSPAPLAAAGVPGEPNCGLDIINPTIHHLH